MYMYSVFEGRQICWVQCMEKICCKQVYVDIVLSVESLRITREGRMLQLPSVRAYSCYVFDCLYITVVTGELPHCRVTTHDGQFIASSAAQSGSCGSESSPWVVEAGSGQKLLFTLHDFAVQPATVGQIHS